MKVAVLGGSAWSTPALAELLQPHASRLNLVLWGRSDARLSAVAGACRLLAPSLASKIDTSTDLPSAVSGVDVILVQVRVGGLAGREFDETFPLAHDICGDEGLGPGGLAAAWRSWPTVRKLLEAVRSTGSTASVFMLTSPVGILTALAQREFPELELYGLCELPWYTLLQRCEAPRSDDARIGFDYVGINHVGWLYNLRCTEQRTFADPIPTKYMEMHYDHSGVLARQRERLQSRAADLTELTSHAFSEYETDDPARVRGAVTARATPWYTHCVAPLVIALLNGHSKVPFFLTSRNGASQSALATGDTIEHPYRVTRGVLKPQSVDQPPPAQCLEVLEPYVEYERAARDAVSERHEGMLLDAIGLHPWVRTHGRLGTADALAAHVSNQPQHEFSE